MARPCDLAGIGVLVTRPAHQAEGLCRLIEAHGGRAIRFPALRIAAPEDPASARRLIADAGRFDILIFVSPNAVTFWNTLSAGAGLPTGPALAAVGRGTERALAAVGRRPDIVPTERFDSEGLLTTPGLMALSGRRVLIVRGAGGRALLGDTLRARGAEVRYAEVYRRLLPVADPEPLLARWTREVGVVTATSNDILRNLVTLLGDRGLSLLRATPLVVVSARGRDYAREQGITRITVAPGAGDRQLLEALCAVSRQETKNGGQKAGGRGQGTAR